MDVWATSIGRPILYGCADTVHLSLKSLMLGVEQDFGSSAIGIIFLIGLDAQAATGSTMSVEIAGTGAGTAHKTANGETARNVPLSVLHHSARQRRTLLVHSTT